MAVVISCDKCGKPLLIKSVKTGSEGELINHHTIFELNFKASTDEVILPSYDLCFCKDCYKEFSNYMFNMRYKEDK